MEKFEIAFPLFHEEEKKLLEVTLEVVELDKPSTEEGRERIKNLVGELFSPSLKEEEGERFSNYVLQWVEDMHEHTFKISLNNYYVELDKNEQLIIYLNKHFRAKRLLKEIASFLVNEVINFNSIKLLYVINLICSLQFLSEFTRLSPDSKVGLAPSWSDLQASMESLYKLNLDWKMLDKIFTIDEQVPILGKLYDELIKNENFKSRYKLESDDNRWVILKLQSMENYMIEVFPWVQDYQEGIKYGMFYGKNVWLDEDELKISIQPKNIYEKRIKRVTKFLVDYRYKFLPQWFNLYVYLLLRKRLKYTYRCSDMLGATNIMLKISEKELPELDIVFLNLYDKSLSIIECTISKSDKRLHNKKETLEKVKEVLTEAGFEVKTTELVTPSLKLERNLDEITVKLAKGTF
ncbi:MAG: hypothetical protein QXF74_02950 [Nitrososphaerota archaeon]